MEEWRGKGERDGESDAIERWLVNERRGVERRGEERTEEGSLSLSLSLRCVAGDLALLNQASTRLRVIMSGFL